MIIDSTCRTLTNSPKSLRGEETLSLRMVLCHKRISTCWHLRILSRPWGVRLKVWWKQVQWTWQVLSSLVQHLGPSLRCRRRRRVISSYPLMLSTDQRTKAVLPIWWGTLLWTCPPNSSRQPVSYPSNRWKGELWPWHRAILGICLTAWCPVLSLLKVSNSSSRWLDRRWCRGCLKIKMPSSYSPKQISSNNYLSY